MRSLRPMRRRCREALNLIGRRVTVDEVLAEVTRDALYFEGSGGGLTLSGGEPLAQPEFAAELLWRYKHEEKGENTAVETCGFVEWPSIDAVSRR
jgi:pyruvate formate lyase activating enzyme